MEEDLQLGGELVADRQPERAVGLEYTNDLASPGLRPFEIRVCLAAVVVDIVIIADVERGVGENQVDGTRRNPWEQLQAVSRVQPVELQRRGHTRHSGRDLVGGEDPGLLRDSGDA